jgi:peptidoglycan/LPS O-acetylase OafA/YrhL
MKPDPRITEDTRTTLAAALALWGAAVMAGSAAGIFARLSAEVILALGAFATMFASGAYFLDANVRRYVIDRRAAAAKGFALLAAIAVAGFAVAPSGAPLAALPNAALLLFVVPLATALAAALLDARSRAAVRSPGSKSPAANPAAT